MAQLEYVVSYPKVRRYAIPLLLMHGAWHGAWCWHDAMVDFAARGFEVHAISWRGHGASQVPRAFNLVSLRDYVADLALAIEAIEPRPVVVGHSLGGYVTQLYLSEHQLPGAVLLCSAPPTGVLPYILRYARRHPLVYARAVATLNLRHMVGTPALAREAFFREDAAPARVAHASALLSSEAVRVALDAMLLCFPKPALNRSRLLVIAGERDAIFTLDEQRALAAAYAAQLLVVPEAAHDLMLDPSWPQAADAIEQFVQRIP
jgi:pimeloyl-ACP methyl ester carboxylesterase